MKLKPAQLALYILTVLICTSPLFWWLGVVWWQAFAGLIFWIALWVFVARLGRDYDHS